MLKNKYIRSIVSIWKTLSFYNSLGTNEVYTKNYVTINTIEYNTYI